MVDAIARVLMGGDGGPNELIPPEPVFDKE